MTLRGDLHKSGVPIHQITDEKVLQIIPNNAMNYAGEPDFGELKSSPSKMGDTKSDLKFRKYKSLLNLDEEAIIIKYCELRAQYDNLKGVAVQKISELKRSSTKVNNDIEEDNEFNNKIKNLMEENENRISIINKEREIESIESRLQITNLSDENAKLKEENIKLREENAELLNKIKSTKEKLELDEKDLIILKDKNEASSIYPLILFI